VESRRKNGAGKGRGTCDERDQKSSECRAFHDRLLRALRESRCCCEAWGGTFKE
jgi:hypothetical protein